MSAPEQPTPEASGYALQLATEKGLPVQALFDGSLQSGTFVILRQTDLAAALDRFAAQRAAEAEFCDVCGWPIFGHEHDHRKEVTEAATPPPGDAGERAREIVARYHENEACFPTYLRDAWLTDKIAAALTAAASQARRETLEAALKFAVFHAETTIKPDGRHTAECIATDIRRALANPQESE